uniref:Uncharacterized protein n=1 Tax=Rhizophora mucronata TaxID=61149 RepID=A0A2P2PGU3_RHIMU
MLTIFSRRTPKVCKTTILATNFCAC